MRALAALLLVLSASLVAAASRDMDADIRAKLVAMGERDQKVREKVASVVSSAGLESEEFKTLAKEMSAVDSGNFAELEKIIGQVGWPGADLVGVEASNAAFLVLQHAPVAQQRRLFPAFEQAVSQGKARAADLALLEDRMLLAEGKKQLYGSQITAGPDGTPRVAPVEDPQNLDARRRAKGLPSMAEYLEHAEKQMGRAIDTQALRAR
jgi:hypothetical protein